MNSIPFSRTFLLFLALGALSVSTAFAQGVQDKHTEGTTLGMSNNTSRDLANSLVVPDKPKIDKHEKKEEVDPKKLVSKKSHDATFSGSLNDIGLDWSGNQLGKSSTGTAKAAESGAKDSKSSKSSELSGDSQVKEPRTSKSEDKSAEKEKTAAKSDSDGSH